MREKRVPCAERVGRFLGSGIECVQVLSKVFLTADMHWREPSHNMRLHYQGQVGRWHRDGNFRGCHFESPYLLLMWSSRTPTEYVDARVWADRRAVVPESEVLRFAPYDFVLVRNRLAWHRMPAEIHPDRETIRVWGPRLKEVRQLKEVLHAEARQEEPSSGDPWYRAGVEGVRAAPNRPT